MAEKETSTAKSAVKNSRKTFQGGAKTDKETDALFNEKTGSCYGLWEILQGTSVIQDPEYISLELQENKDKLAKGISFFKKPSATSKEKLEKETQVKPLRRDFILKLSKFLNLDEWQSLELFHSYLQNSFRGSREQLQNVFKNEIHTETLLIKVMEYYFEERIFLLNSLETILGHWRDPSHPFQNTFSVFVDEMMEKDQLISEVWNQYKECCKSSVHLPMDNEHDMSKRHCHRFAQQLLREQIAVLHLVFFLYKDFQQPASTFLEAVKLFQAQSFGLRQVNRQVFDGFTELLVTQIGFLQVCILVEGMDLENLIPCDEESLKNHPIVKEKDIMKELDIIFSKWGDLVHHGPVILAWTVLRFIAMETDLDNHTQDLRRMGTKALSCNVFPYLLNLMKSEPFSSDTVFSNSVKSVFYTLLSIVLTLFHESTLGDPLILIAVLKETLTSQELCQMFWESEVESGMAMLLKSAKNKFPFRFTPFIQIMASLAKDEQTSENVYKYLENMDCYTEPSNENSLRDVDCTDSDETLWKLINAKILFKNVVSTADKIVIPCGTFGKVYMSTEGVHLLRWSFPYSCWQLFLLELDLFLQQAPASDHELQFAVGKVIDIIELVNNVLKHNWEKITPLVMLIDRVYYILQRYSPNPNSPSQLLTACVKCLTTVTSQEPVQSWISFQQTGFLPFCISSLQPAQKVILISSIAVDPGNYGNFLTTNERSQGSYSVTLATLDLIKELVAIVSPAERSNTVPGINDFIACLVFLCRDVFNGYRKWHYQDLKEKQEIGLKCLEVFHKILTTKECEEDQILLGQTFDVSIDNEYEELSNTAKLCDMLVEGMLWTDIGQSLLHIVGIGMGIIDKLFAVHGSCSDSPAQLVVKLIKSALKVLNEVLNKKPKCSDQHDITPLEQTLISHVSRKLGNDTPEGIHLISIISSYLYYKQDSELGAVAMELLRKISIISPMSMYGSLGSRAESLRDVFAIKLTSITEDIYLKVAILDFLSSAVQTQPGLMELFLDFTPIQYSTTDDKDTKPKELEIGSNSCIRPVLACITKKKDVPAFSSVLAASYKFLYALWKNGRELAMVTVKKSGNFWENLSQHLLDDLPEETEEDFICHLQICSFAFQIIAQELHYIKSGGVDVSLKQMLEQFKSKERFLYWSNQVSKVTALSSSQHTATDSLEYSLNFLRSWRSFLIVLADSEVSSVCFRDDDVKMLVLKNTVECINNQFNEEITSRSLRIALEKSSLFLMLLRKWIKSVHSPTLFVDLVALRLQTADNADPKLLAYIRIPLFTSLSLLLQYIREERILEDLEIGSITTILPLVCEPLEYNIDVKETRDIQRQNKIHTVTICLLNEIVTCISQPMKWMQIFTEHALFTNLIQILDRSLRKKENLDVVESALYFILSLSKYIEAAQALSLNLIVQPLCLGMASLHKKLTNSDIDRVTFLESTTMTARWDGVWGLGLTVMSSLLGKLRYEFLKESLDFVGVHREKIVNAMDMVRMNQTPSCLREAEHITMFLVEFSSYRKEWQLALPDVLQMVLSSATVLFETCVSLLIHPRLLAYLIEKPSYHSSTDKSDSASSSGRTLSRTVSSTSELLRPYSTPDEPLEKQNPKVVEAQKRLLKIVCNLLGFLKNFSPNICEMLLDEGMDIDEYILLFGVDFKTPVMDNESSPSFGALVSCLNMCLGHVHAAYPRPSASPEKSPWKFTALSSALPKTTVNFAMENACILLLSQAFLYLKDPRVESAKKETLKRRLSSELEPFLSGIINHFERRGYSSSPGSTPTSASPVSSGRSFSRARSEHRETGDQKELKLFQLVALLLKSVKSESKDSRW